MTNLSMPRCDIEELKGQIEQLKALNTADDYLIKLLEEQNQQLKELLYKCREMLEAYQYSEGDFRIGDNAEISTSLLINMIDNAIGENK